MTPPASLMLLDENHNHILKKRWLEKAYHNQHSKKHIRRIDRLILSLPERTSKKIVGKFSISKIKSKANTEHLLELTLKRIIFTN